MKWGILATGTIAKKSLRLRWNRWAQKESSLLPWGPGIWKVHRPLHSSTASLAAMTPMMNCQPQNRKRRNKQLPVCRADRHLKTTKNECWRSRTYEAE